MAYNGSMIDSKELQRQIDQMFGQEKTKVGLVEFSLTVADPTLIECPLIGCSTGFSNLCGYKIADICGRNCRFLIDPVPPNLVNNNFRKLCRDYIEAIRTNSAFVVPDDFKQSWMEGAKVHIRRVGTLFSGVRVRTSDGGLFCYQINARQNRTLFRNMFFLHTVELFGKPYILGFQSQVPNPKVIENLWGAIEGTARFYEKYPPLEADLTFLKKNCGSLSNNMVKVEEILMKMFAKKQTANIPKAPKEQPPKGMFACCCASKDPQDAQGNSMIPTQAVLDPMIGGGSLASGLATQNIHIPERVEGNAVPVFGPVQQAVDKMKTRAQISRASGGAKHPPCDALYCSLDGTRTDWGRVRGMAKSICKKEYSLRDFMEDLCVAFPELNLYLLEVEGGAAISSGRTSNEEYQRTLGAFFAIYWLFRIRIDGKAGFAFGVNDTWEVLEESKPMVSRDPWEKRVTFHTNSNWDYFECLLEDADLIHISEDGECIPNENRVVSLLSLTAMHDIMKVTDLLPEVQKQHAPYNGYKEGEKIQDHDMALSYVMEYYPDMLPSYKGLSPEEQFAIQFTQAKISFNHGWFVQAEAPPGALFTKFRTLLMTASSKLSFPIRKEDIALYFVHWITDLAGAEPTPLAGCDKFVVKFPLPVLNSFLRSFEFVERLCVETETEVNEDYLKTRWIEQTPSRGSSPTGPSAVAKMRILCMSQSNAPKVLDAFDALPREDQSILSEEMGRTGVQGQSYSANLVPKEVYQNPKGPCFLLYYGPALLQNLQGDTPTRRLKLVAELFRRARMLWPATTEMQGNGANVRVDAIKGMGCDEMMKKCENGEKWMLVKQNESEAVVEKKSQADFDALMEKGEGQPLTIPRG
mmetsp:Transcript_35937/g.84137  ORF Transcript_35937/g.84137 Transcript_35937/m.84137 type:complete len:864 (-) Transcript_35937:121-2712(-)|eukprot:CAMPEP_0178431586 /NCGR_PEP_ID=MMETSP0689_2-20121128/31931_1 /TAXON_ID=160604 /ORGANISM="Amphidinium massartii, Strain CS-259" /LENGTH=863 /DNA_ID=CAMNT_0020053517 /DNA_START=77 /DNA_END=2668 /DNA_ORIENTATION=-